MNKEKNISIVLIKEDFKVLLKILLSKETISGACASNGFGFGDDASDRVISLLKSNLKVSSIININLVSIGPIDKKDILFILGAINFWVANNESDISENKSSSDGINEEYKCALRIVEILENLIIDPESINGLGEFFTCTDHTVIFDSFTKINFTYIEGYAILSAVQAFIHANNNSNSTDTMSCLIGFSSAISKLIDDWNTYDLHCIVFTSLNNLKAVAKAIKFSINSLYNLENDHKYDAAGSSAIFYMIYTKLKNAIHTLLSNSSLAENLDSSFYNNALFGINKIVINTDKYKIPYIKAHGDGGCNENISMGSSFNFKSKIKYTDIFEDIDIPDQEENQSLEEYFENVVMEFSRIIQIDTYDLGTFCRDITFIAEKVSHSTSIIEDVKVLKDEFFNNLINESIPDISYVPGWWIKRILEEFNFISTAEFDKVNDLINNLKTSDRLKSIIDYLLSEVEKIYPSKEVKKED